MTPKTLTLSNGTAVTYKPLPVLGGADEYLSRYGEHLYKTGVFDTLSFRGAGIDLDSLASTDLSTLALFGQTLVELLTSHDSDGNKRTSMTLTSIVLDHCQCFGVEVASDGKTVALADSDAINAHFDDIWVLFELVGRLAWTVFGPLFDRLKSIGEERRKQSAKPSPESAPAS